MSRQAPDFGRLHVETLFTLNGADRLMNVNGPGGGPAPRLLVLRAPDGARCWVRHDVESGLAGGLAELVASDPIRFGPDPGFESAERLLTRLGLAAPVERGWIGPVFRFPDRPAEPARHGRCVRVTQSDRGVLAPLFPDWLSDLDQGAPLTAWVEDDRAVSLCCSVRLGKRAHEAGVETHPDHRGRGHAAPVVAAWARVVREEGLVPLYSTSWENAASLAVARRLGLVQYASTFHAT